MIHIYVSHANIIFIIRFIQQTDVFILCYSISSNESFKNITEKWWPELQKFDPKIPIILVGNLSNINCLFENKVYFIIIY